MRRRASSRTSTRSLRTSGSAKDERANAESVKAEVPKVFQDTRGIYDNLMKTRQVLAQKLPGSFCIIGITATSTTDIGVNPFVGQYVNVGTHASVVNTILQGRFLNQLPWWYGVLLALIFSFAVTFAILNMDAMRSLVVGGAGVDRALRAVPGAFSFSRESTSTRSLLSPRSS